MKLPPEKIKSSIERYCISQDRSTHEVEQKLIKLGVLRQECEEWITHLKENRFIDNLRFATQMARGKLMSNKWGKFKIRQTLRQHRIDDEDIEQALSGLDETEYFNIMLKRAHSKMPELLRKHPDNAFNRKMHLNNYLRNAGFEDELFGAIWEQVDEEK